MLRSIYIWGALIVIIIIAFYFIFVLIKQSKECIEENGVMRYLFLLSCMIIGLFALPLFLNLVTLVLTEIITFIFNPFEYWRKGLH